MAKELAKFLKLDYKVHTDYIDNMYKLVSQIDDFDSVNFRYRKLFSPFVAVFCDHSLKVKKVITKLFQVYLKYIPEIYEEFQQENDEYPSKPDDTKDYPDEYDDYHQYMYNRTSKALAIPFADTDKMQEFMEEASNVIHDYRKGKY